ncbi:MAG: hypothetical protein ABI051_16085 [Vicinamibacterales bacterium]
MRIAALGTLLTLLMIGSADITTPQSGVRVSGRVFGIPTGMAVERQVAVLNSREARLTVPLRSDGSFEFSNVPPGRANVSALLLTGSVAIDVAGRDIADLVLRTAPDRVFGEIVVEGEDRLPISRSALGPSVRVEPVPWTPTASVIVRADGSFMVSSLKPGAYKLRVSMVPAGYAVKAMTAAGRDVTGLEIKIAQDGVPTFVRIDLSKATGGAEAPASPALETFETAPRLGNALLLVSRTGRREPMFIEGAIPFFTVSSTSSPTVQVERRLGGEWCTMEQHASCQPSGASEQDQAAFWLAAGTYELISSVRPCNGNCGLLSRPTDECRAAITLRAGQTLFAQRVEDGSSCTVRTSTTPFDSR